jgi:DNA-directed RNA polymerase subunit RPC12/RpoP
MAVPLTKPDMGTLKNAIYECRECLTEVERMKECGINCQELEARNLHLMKYLEDVQRVYSPLVFNPPAG